jgi:2-succinyl-6-hydroxy-2,4-cyclohexadiene-1-carboxylate synthase
MGTGTQPAQHARLGDVRAPVWLGHGADDAKFADIARDLAARLPSATRCAIPRAGHAAHLENRNAVAAELLRFFAQVERRPPSPPPTEPLRTAQGDPA